MCKENNCILSRELIIDTVKLQGSQDYTKSMLKELVNRKIIFEFDRNGESSYFVPQYIPDYDSTKVNKLVNQYSNPNNPKNPDNHNNSDKLAKVSIRVTQVCFEYYWLKLIGETITNPEFNSYHTKPDFNSYHTKPDLYIDYLTFELAHCGVKYLIYRTINSSDSTNTIAVYMNYDGQSNPNSSMNHVINFFLDSFFTEQELTNKIEIQYKSQSWQQISGLSPVEITVENEGNINIINKNINNNQLSSGSGNTLTQVSETKS